MIEIRPATQVDFMHGADGQHAIRPQQAVKVKAVSSQYEKLTGLRIEDMDGMDIVDYIEVKEK